MTGRRVGKRPLGAGASQVREAEVRVGKVTAPRLPLRPPLLVVPLGAGCQQTEPGAARGNAGAARRWRGAAAPAAGGRGSHLVSGAGAARTPQRRGRPGAEHRSGPAPGLGGADSEAAAGALRGGWRRVAADDSRPGGTWQPPAGRAGKPARWGRAAGWWRRRRRRRREAERRRGPAGPGPAQPSALPRPDTAPGAEMADEPQKKPHLSALVGHTNGLTKPASLAAATRAGGGGGGATASSKKLVIKNFRGGCGAGRALRPGRCARPRRPAPPDLCLPPARPLPASSPRQAGRRRRGPPGPGRPRRCHPPRRLIWARGSCRRADNPPRCRQPPRRKALRGHAWGSVRGGSGRSGAATACAP